MGYFSIRVNVVAVWLKMFGAFIFSSGFFGCCGARQSHLLLVCTLAVFLSLLLGAQLVAVFLVLILHDKVVNYMTEALLATMSSYSRRSDVTVAWDQTQKQFNCCGTTAFTDWQHVQLPLPTNVSGYVMNIHQHSVISVPDSCCVERWLDCGWNVLGAGSTQSTSTSTSSSSSSSTSSSYSSLSTADMNISNIHTDACTTAILTWLEENSLVIVLTGLLLVLIQLTGIVLACSLARNIRDQCRRPARWPPANEILKTSS
jgi:hypothetical protein